VEDERKLNYMSTGYYIDYKYTLDLVRRINKAVEVTPVLANHFQCEGYNLLERFQAILWSDTKVWTMEKKVPDGKVTLSIKIKSAVTGLLLLAVSVISLTFFVFKRRDEVAVFTDDKTEGPFKNDTRLNAVYEALNAGRKRYLEVVHTVPRSLTFFNFFKRRRFVVYLEAVDFIYQPFIWIKSRKIRHLISQVDLSSFNANERIFVKNELEKLALGVPASMAKLKLFTWLMKCLRIKLCFSIDDTRHYSEFVEAGRRCKIPTFAIQHGHFTKYHTGWIKMSKLDGAIMKADYIVVWSEYWKNELKKLGSYFKDEDVIVGGAKGGVEKLLLRSGSAIVVPYEKDAPKESVKHFIDEVMRCGKYEIVFKARAGIEDLNCQLAEYNLMPEDVTVAVDDKEVLKKVALVAGTYSTYLYDCVEKGIPVAIIESEIDYGEGMVENGLASFIKMDNRICETIENCVNVSAAELGRREVLLRGEEDIRLSHTLSNLIEKYASD